MAIKRIKENQRLYLHEVEIQERLEQFIQTSQTQDVNAPAFKLIIADYKKNTNTLIGKVIWKFGSE